MSFRYLIESTINMSFLSKTKTLQRIIHRRGSTSGAPPLTKAPLYGVCRVKTSKFFFIGIRLKTCIMDIYISTDSRHVARPHGRLAQTDTSMFSLNNFSQETKDKTPSLMRVIPKKITPHRNKIEVKSIIKNDALCMYPVSAQRPDRDIVTR